MGDGDGDDDDDGVSVVAADAGARLCIGTHGASMSRTHAGSTCMASR